jgi:hypothetical protein
VLMGRAIRREESSKLRRKKDGKCIGPRKRNRRGQGRGKG